MAQDITVPDLGDFKDVEVIDVLVKAGDKIDVDTPLLTLETEKATMDVPSTAAGVVKSVAMKKGDRVSKGSVIVQVEARQKRSGTAEAAAPPARRQPSSPQPPTHRSRSRPAAAAHLQHRLRRQRNRRRSAHRERQPCAPFAIDEAGFRARARESVGSQVRARARRGSRRRQRHRHQRTHHARRRQGLGQAGA